MTHRRKSSLLNDFIVRKKGIYPCAKYGASENLNELNLITRLVILFRKRNIIAAIFYVRV